VTFNFVINLPITATRSGDNPRRIDSNYIYGSVIVSKLLDTESFHIVIYKYFHIQRNIESINR